MCSGPLLSVIRLLARDVKDEVAEVLVHLDAFLRDGLGQDVRALAGLAIRLASR